MEIDKKQIDAINELTNKTFSPTFCFAKWHHSTIYLQTGETHSCYHPSPHKIPLEELEDNPSALHNTAEKKSQRRQMLEGKKPSGCNYCWKIEALGKDYVSDRHMRSASIYTDERMHEIRFSPWDFNVNPEYIEISFGNECNFRCGYCHPKASSRYYQEIQKHGPYDVALNHRNDIDWFTIFEENSNPYVDAWWEWWPEVSKTLNILRVTGGEPTIQQSTYRLFEELEHDPKPHLELNVNSNFGGKPRQLEKFTNCVNSLLEQEKIKKFKLFTSIDTWGERAEYIRDGLDIEVFERNLDYFMNNCSAPVSFMITFNIFSVTTFDTLLEKILEWRKKYNVNGKQRIEFDTPHLKEPIQYDMNILPKDEFIPYMEKHLKFIKDNQKEGDVNYFSDIEYEKFRRVVDYMRNSDYTQERLDQGRVDFWRWFNEHDRRRGKNFKKTFPEMQNFFSLCKVISGDG